MYMVRARYGGSARVFLLAGGNWNNGQNAGPSYRNANNDVTNSNRNNGTHLELRYRLGSPDQRTDLSPGEVILSRAKDDTMPRGGASTRIYTADRSPSLAGLVF